MGKNSKVNGMPIAETANPDVLPWTNNFRKPNSLQPGSLKNLERGLATLKRLIIDLEAYCAGGKSDPAYEIRLAQLKCHYADIELHILKTKSTACRGELIVMPEPEQEQEQEQVKGAST